MRIKLICQGYKTVGIVEMGGASMQFAFAIHPDEVPDDHTSDALVSFKLLGKQYSLYAKSLLGWGIDQAISKLKEPACFPKGYSEKDIHGSGKSFQDCKKKIISKLFKKDDILIPNKDMIFYGFGNFYYFGKSVGISDSDKVSAENYLSFAEKYCSQDFDTLKSEFKTEKNLYVGRKCIIPSLLNYIALAY